MQYKGTFLAKHHLTVVEEKKVTSILQDDQHDANSTTANNGETYNTKIIVCNKSGLVPVNGLTSSNLILLLVKYLFASSYVKPLIV